VDVIGMSAAFVILAIGVQWYTAAVCNRFGRWLFPTVVVLDFLIGCGRWPVSFLLWKLCFFYGLARWDPMRGLFRLPRWPRVHQRGRGGRRKREFPEPMPWTRGPGSY
jgi:hypothetical protein